MKLFERFTQSSRKCCLEKIDVSNRYRIYTNVFYIKLLHEYFAYIYRRTTFFDKYILNFIYVFYQSYSLFVYFIYLFNYFISRGMYRF